MRLFPGTLSLLLASGLCAAGPAPQDWAQLKGVYLRPENAGCLKDTAGLGLGAGRWFTSRWGAEVDLVDAALKSGLGLPSAREQQFQGAALFNLNPEGMLWFPYLRAGLGAGRVASPYSLSRHATTRLAYHGGAGIQRFFGKQGLGSFEVRAVNLETSERRTEYQGLLSLGLRWGAPAVVGVAAAPVVPPTPVAEVPPPAPLPVKPVPAPEPAPLPPPPAPEPPKAPEPPPAKIILDEALLHFANNQAVLPTEAIEAIRTVAKSLKGYTGSYELVVTGHTSSLGGKAYNKTLSLKRAQAVAAILVAEGIAAERVKTAGMGPDQPLADNKTKEGQAKNRRVEIDVKAAGVEVKRTETALHDPSEAVKKKPAKH